MMFIKFITWKEKSSHPPEPFLFTKGAITFCLDLNILCRSYPSPSINIQMDVVSLICRSCPPPWINILTNEEKKLGDCYGKF